MSNQFKTKEFKALQDKWYKILAQKDFEDIEKNEHSLKLWHADYFADARRNDENVIQAKQEYYRLAGQFLFEYKFKNPMEKRIWQLHSDGKSIREIERTLTKGYKTYKDHIHRILQALEVEMINKCKNPPPSKT